MTARITKLFAILTALLLIAAVVPARADDNRTPISRERILGALDSSGIRITPEQLEQLSSVTASEPNPRLKVISVEVLDGEADKALLRCEQPRTCLPFYVLVHWGNPGDDPSAPSSWQEGRPTQPDLKPEDMLVHSGRVAVLVIEGDYIRMTLPVMCLQNGGRGQRVRVIDKDTRNTYLARVTGLGVVTSDLRTDGGQD